jgi:hypothetical protein
MPGIDSLIVELVCHRAMDRTVVRGALARNSPSEQIFRFLLVNREVGSFAAQRWCYRG